MTCVWADWIQDNLYYFKNKMNLCGLKISGLMYSLSSHGRQNKSCGMIIKSTHCITYKKYHHRKASGNSDMCEK